MNADDGNGWGEWGSEWSDLFARAKGTDEGADGDGVDARDVRAALASCRDER